MSIRLISYLAGSAVVVSGVSGASVYVHKTFVVPKEKKEETVKQEPAQQQNPGFFSSIVAGVRSTVGSVGQTISAAKDRVASTIGLK